ncbi:MAG: thymidine phosphorylase [Ignavibacteriaceae bacterium]|nr:thymidine phosphorylase [Ignavibacteriaceae bacterium]
MNVTELIRKKRNKELLTKEEILFLVSGFTKEEIPDYQFAAFLMAVYLNGMSKDETFFLTEVMLNSGKVLSLESIKGFKVDKHSTGGVGDKTSLIIAPIVAAAGLKVPMISGRGLGHSGGTLDKLESIPGFNVNLNLKEYKKVLSKCGAVLIGQTKEIAPADKLIYALRDVTATVESIPLITASIMSKKMAEGIDGLVLDVKTGSGAFMRDMKDAEALAESLISTAKSFGKKVIAFITDMNQPLGNYIGNWLEVYESVKILKGEKKGDLYDLSLTLSGAMLYLGMKLKSIEEGFNLSEKMISSGKAYEKFVEIVKLQQGDESFIINPEKFKRARFSEKLTSSSTGFLSKIDNYQIGMASLELGAGRKTKADTIDYAAGIIFYPRIGDYIKKNDVIAELFSNNKNNLEIAKKRILGSLTYSPRKVNQPKLIKKIFI